ncbi:MAG: biotin/lipoyl-containing protein [Chlorobiota bacterium]
MIIKYNNELLELESNQIDNNYTVKIDDNTFSFRIVNKESNKLELIIDDNSEEVYYTSHKDKIFLHFNGKQHIFQKVENELELEGSEFSENVENIIPPMPGTIIKVNFDIGDNVNEGDAVVVVEAMKMETNLYTRISGKVTEVNVKEGDRVDSEDVLVKIEKE